MCHRCLLIHNIHKQGFKSHPDIDFINPMDHVHDIESKARITYELCPQQPMPTLWMLLLRHAHLCFNVTGTDLQFQFHMVHMNLHVCNIYLNSLFFLAYTSPFNLYICPISFTFQPDFQDGMQIVHR